MEIYLIRHGEVEMHYRERFYGGSEVDLSPFGREQAAAAAEDLSGCELHAIYCSPLSRASFGAEEIARRQNGLRPIKVEAFREIDRGRWTGLLKSEVLGAWPQDWIDHQNDLEGWRDHGGESLGDLYARVSQVFEEICSARKQDDAIAIVAHLFPISAMLAFSSNVALKDWRHWSIPTGSISKLKLAGSGLKVEFVGRTPA